MTVPASQPASRSVAQVRENQAGSAPPSVTMAAGLGGDLEAVTLHTGLLAARPCSARTWPWSRRDRAIRPGTRWGFRGGGRRGGQRGGGAGGAAGGRRCGSATRTRGSGTRCVAPQPDRLGRWRWPARTWWCRTCRASPARGVTAQAAPPGTRHGSVRVGVDGLPEALGRCPVPRSKGRVLAAAARFLAAAAAGRRHAAALLRGARAFEVPPAIPGARGHRAVPPRDHPGRVSSLQPPRRAWWPGGPNRRGE